MIRVILQCKFEIFMQLCYPISDVLVVVRRPSNTLYYDRHTGCTAAAKQAHNNVNKAAKRKKVTTK